MDTRPVCDLCRSQTSTAIVSSSALWMSYIHEDAAVRVCYSLEVKAHREQAIRTLKTQKGPLLGAVMEACLKRNEAVKKMRANSSALGVTLATITKPVLLQPFCLVDRRARKQYDKLFDNLSPHQKENVHQSLVSRLITVLQVTIWADIYQVLHNVLSSSGKPNPWVNGLLRWAPVVAKGGWIFPIYSGIHSYRNHGWEAVAAAVFVWPTAYLGGCLGTVASRFLRVKPLGDRRNSLWVITTGSVVVAIELAGGYVGSKVGWWLGGHLHRMCIGGIAIPEFVVPAQILRCVSQLVV